MTPPSTKPVEWLVFYSEKAGREYYYEPNSKIATWILPDDLHPSGTATGTGMTLPVQQQQQPAMARRVSFHQSVETTVATRETFVEAREERKQEERTRFRWKPIELWIILLAVSILIVLGLIFTRESPSVASIHQIVTIDVNHRIENDLAEGSLEDASSLSNIASVKEDEQQRSLNSITPQEIKINDSVASQEILIDPVTENDGQAGPVTTRPVIENQVASKAIIEDPVASRDIIEDPAASQDISVHPETTILVEPGRIKEHIERLLEPSTSIEQSRTKVEQHACIPDNIRYDLGLARPPSNDGSKLPRNVNKSCFVPFSHLFSKKCRQLAKERPLIDISSFLDGMMQ